MKKILLFICIFTFFTTQVFASDEKLDLNNAPFEQIRSLPITEQQAEDIYNYRTYIDFFNSVYDLREVQSIDQETLLKLKPLVAIYPYSDYGKSAQRRDQINYLLRRLASNEGSQESISDIWEDLLLTPINVNTATFNELQNLPTVSPTDVRAVLVQRNIDDFSDYRNLRHSPDLTHYGATRLKHYIIYDQPELTKRVFANYRFEFNNSPFSEEAEEVMRQSFLPESTTELSNMWDRLDMNNAAPELTHKLRIRTEDWINLGFGSMVFLDKGENRDLNFFKFQCDFLKTIKKNSKTYFYMDLKPLNTKLILGNFRATYGQGLILDNTDFFGRRNTGFGFSKRVLGISPDLSKTQEFSLRGGAVEFNNTYINASFFYSQDKKDGVIWDSNHDNQLDENDDLLYYIISKPSFSNSELIEIENYVGNTLNDSGYIKIAPRRDAFEEKLRGGHVEISPLIGSHLGFTAYEAIYDRHFNIPTQEDLPNTLVDTSEVATEKFKLTDNSISSLYSTINDDYERDYRRIYGFDWQTTYNSFCFQGEYAELEKDGSITKLGDDPKALVASGYFNFPNLNFLMLYRNYDLGFDNPYARPFAEHERFDGSILEKQYYMNNPLVSEMYYNSPWSQAEEGIYIESRYKFLRQLTLTKAYLDIWKRKCDGRVSVRFQGELDYRPIYQVSIRLKQKWQTNGSEDQFTRSVSKTSETSLKLKNYLTNRDNLSFEYRFTKVWMCPYTSLTNPANPNHSNIVPTADVLNHGDFIAVNYVHNFNNYSRLEGEICFWNGHGISHWDWEDMEIDFMGSQGMKYWFTFYNRLSNNLAISFKFKVKNYEDEELYLRQYNQPIPGENYLAQVKHKDTSIRIQLDWNF